MLPNLSFVLGGAGSGKSAFAEGIVGRTGLNRVYIATAQAFDDEMRGKIAAHRAMRGGGWQTIEAPLDLAGALAGRDAGDIVLVDCLTLWLSNVILAEQDPEPAAIFLLQALRDMPCPVVAVSNEVGLGIVPDNALGRRFRAAQGRLNQQIAAAAGLVVLVTAGLPHVLKGALPEAPE